MSEIKKLHSSDKRQDETFVGNHSVNKLLTDLIGVECRLGEQAYDIYGEPINKNVMLPLYVKNSDLARYNSIRENQLKAIRAGK